MPDVERVDDETRKRKHFFFEKKEAKNFYESGARVVKPARIY
jgi:hypothetical protein